MSATAEYNITITPDDFRCPITTELINQPVIMNGKYYEKEAITFWLSKNNRDPLTNEKLNKKTKVIGPPSFQYRKLLKKYIENNPQESVYETKEDIKNKKEQMCDISKLIINNKYNEIIQKNISNINVTIPKYYFKKISLEVLMYMEKNNIGITDENCSLCHYIFLYSNYKIITSFVDYYLENDIETLYKATTKNITCVNLLFKRNIKDAILKFISCSKIKLNRYDANNMSPLHYIASSKHADLINKFIDIYVSNPLYSFNDKIINTGDTFLHILCKNRYGINVINRVLDIFNSDYGIDNEINIMELNNDGYTAFHNLSQTIHFSETEIEDEILIKFIKSVKNKICTCKKVNYLLSNKNKDYFRCHNLVYYLAAKNKINVIKTLINIYDFNMDIMVDIFCTILWNGSTEMIKTTYDYYESNNMIEFNIIKNKDTLEFEYRIIYSLLLNKNICITTFNKMLQLIHKYNKYNIYVKNQSIHNNIKYSFHDDFMNKLLLINILLSEQDTEIKKQLFLLAWDFEHANGMFRYSIFDYNHNAPRTMYIYYLLFENKFYDVIYKIFNETYYNDIEEDNFISNLKQCETNDNYLRLLSKCKTEKNKVYRKSNITDAEFNHLRKVYTTFLNFTINYIFMSKRFSVKVKQFYINKIVSEELLLRKTIEQSQCVSSEQSNVLEKYKKYYEQLHDKYQQMGSMLTKLNFIIIKLEQDETSPKKPKKE